MNKRTGAETLIFWGAGATQGVGFHTTVQQSKYIKKLVGDKSTLTEEKVGAAQIDSKWQPLLADLLIILGDDTPDAFQISREAYDAMSQHWAAPSRPALETRILELRTLFDWQALKIAAQICPGFTQGEGFLLQDLFNVIDLHIQSGHGFPTQHGFLPPHRVVAARRALQLMLNTLLFIDWQAALSHNRQGLDRHLGLARILAEHHQQQGLALAANREYFDSRDFYLGDIAFVSLNYDPVALWAQFIANRDANQNPPYIDFPRVPLKIFHDFGIFMAVSSINPKSGAKEEKERVWYPLNEASAQRLNDRDHECRRVRINKFLFPHGCLCWRECPSCGKLTAYMGKQWEFFSSALIPPPPLRGFAEKANIVEAIWAESPEEHDAWQRGEVDARACVHCGEMTYAQHTQAVMQSNFKATPPSFIEEVQRDLRVATQAAKHIVLMGYSLPPDDVTYRAFFAARQQRSDKQNTPAVRCSVVVGRNWGNNWHYADDIDRLLLEMPKGEAPCTTLEAARSLFGRDNVRFYGGGIPQVWCDGDVPSIERLQKIVNWDNN